MPASVKTWVNAACQPLNTSSHTWRMRSMSLDVSSATVAIGQPRS
jgi:hypothetical protein